MRHAGVGCYLLTRASILDSSVCLQCLPCTHFGVSSLLESSSVQSAPKLSNPRDICLLHTTTRGRGYGRGQGQGSVADAPSEPSHDNEKTVPRGHGGRIFETCLKCAIIHAPRRGRRKFVVLKPSIFDFKSNKVSLRIPVYRKKHNRKTNKICSAKAEHFRF
jgi:hypothetical protein